MQVFKRLLAFVYILASAVALGTFGAYLFSPEARRIEVLFQKPVVRYVLLSCMVIAGLGALIGGLRMLFARRPVTCVHPHGNPNIEVSVGAVESVARTAAQDPEALIETVRARVQGRDASETSVYVEAIALGRENLDARAERIRERVRSACENMLGGEAVSVRVRFLPGKTTIVTQEVAHEHE